MRVEDRVMHRIAYEARDHLLNGGNGPAWVEIPPWKLSDSLGSVRIIPTFTPKDQEELDA